VKLVPLAPYARVVWLDTFPDKVFQTPVPRPRALPSPFGMRTKTGLELKVCLMNGHMTGKGEKMSDQNTNENTEKKIINEEVKVSGEAVVGKVKEILREGNIRRITIKNDTGKTLLEIPLTFGVVGALIAPQLAALGAVGALIANLSIGIERESEDLVVNADANAEGDSA